jgi:opacity protein-like surface antigen
MTSLINTVNTAFLTTTTAFVSAPSNPAPDQQGGGAWGRVIGGTVEANTNSVGTVNILPGSINCDTKTRSDYFGYQVGHDISVLNGGGTGANFHVGVTAGYLEAKTRDITPGAFYFNPVAGQTFFSPPGTFVADSQVPFVGAYAAFTQGNFSLDGQARWDFFQNALTEPLYDMSNQRVDARGFSLTGNAAYNIPLGNNWFIEPSGGVIWSRVNVDPLNVQGVNIGPLVFGSPSPAFPPFFLGSGTVSFDTIESVLGRASLSVGTSFAAGGVTWQPYFTASVFHEFAGDVTARSTGLLGTPGFSLPLGELTTRSEGGVGTYGQFALGTAAVLGNSGWLAYARGDYRIGDVIEGWSVGAGLRYQFSPTARGSIKDGPARVVYGYDWSGPYIGAFVGSVWGKEPWRFVEPPNSTLAPDFAGNIAGGQVGYNVQFGRTVLGVEADYGATIARGGISCPNAFFFTCQADAHQLASVAGRLGATWGRALFYGKAGWAGGEVSASGKLNVSQNPLFNFPPVAPFFVNGVETTKWLNGWTAGGGVEFAVSDRWSAKAEYMYYDLGKDRFEVSDGPEHVDADIRAHVVRIGLNLHLQPQIEPAPLK